MSEATIMTTIGETPAEPAEPTEPENLVGADAPAPAPTPAEAASPAVTPNEKIELARRYEAAAKRESRSRRASEEAQRTLQAVQMEREAFQKEREAFKADLEAFRSDPVGYEIKQGRDPVDVVRRASAPETPEQKEIRELKEWRAQQERSLEEQKTQAQKRADEDHRDASLRSFVGSITPDECPNVTTLYRASEVPDLVSSLLNEPTEDGDTLLEAFRDKYRRNPTNVEIKQALEHRASIRDRALYEGLRKIHGAQQPGTADPNASESTRAPSLSNQHAGRLESSNGGGRKLTLEERRAASLRSVRDQLEAEAESS